MVTEVLVKESLSSEMVSAGEELTRRLDEAGFIVSASLWLYTAEANNWRLIIGSPGVEVLGPRRVYRQVQSVISKMPSDRPRIPLKDITVIDSNDPLLNLLRTAIKTGHEISNERLTTNVINGTLIEGAYVYRVR